MIQIINLSPNPTPTPRLGKRILTFLVSPSDYSGN